jgi:radical SAM superfamily enzyme YgiQ (UPF0313 family)
MIGFNIQEDIFPLGLSYLKSYALKKHPDVEFKIKEFGFGNRFDYDSNKNIELKIISYILLEKPKLVVFSSYVWSGEVIKKICRAIKICNPKIITLMGGAETRKEDLNEFVDYIISGEGELAFSRFISFLKKEIKIEQVNNLIYKKQTNKIETISNLDEVPFPYMSWDGKKEFNVVRIETTRGCNYDCKYCNYAKKKYRKFSIQYLKKSIKYLFDNFTFKNLTILDANFNIDKKRMKEILDIIESNIKGKLRVNFELKPELIDEEVIAIIKNRKFSINCELGLQSIDKKVIDSCNRPFNIDKVKKALKLLNNNKINYKIDLMYGLPKDNFYKFLRSFNFLTKYSTQKKIPAHHFMVLNNTLFSKCNRYDENNSSKVIKTDTQDCIDFYKTQLFINLINEKKHYSK